jgi:transketolase
MNGEEVMNEKPTEQQGNIDEICVNTIRSLSIDAIQRAKSGHPGAPMGLAPAGYVLWTRVLKHNPKNPHWPDRDRFVLSNGHASMLLYCLLYLTGYDLNLEDIKNFRQWQSRTPGHPEYGHTAGVETTSGPLGQGFANAVGMAMAERHLAARFNRAGHEIVDHYTYLMCGDGDLMEGVASEAASLAGHLGLDRLICIYDDNRISIEGSTAISFTEDVALRFKAYNWHVQRVTNGNDLEGIKMALEAARAETQRPSLIVLRTNIGYGSPNKQDTADAHGSPLGEEEVRLTKHNLGCPDQPFCIPDPIKTIVQECIQRGEEAETSWQGKLQAYANKFPELARQWANALENVLPDGWDVDLPDFSDIAQIPTRLASGQVLNALAGKVPDLIGGSADLAPSTRTVIEDNFDFQRNNYAGRNIRFGVREHAMGGILNGLALHKGLRSYGGTFLVFADYMRPSIRLASLMKLPVIYIFSHDSIAVGEDGPTHQPVEQLASLRAVPGLTVIRPADAIETVAAWRQAMQTTDGPVALVLSRTGLKVLKDVNERSQNGLSSGAYILSQPVGPPDLILIATGSEVHIALEASKVLLGHGISAQVVNMPSWELFERTSSKYKNSVLPPEVTKRIVVEAGISLGWERYVGRQGLVIGMNGFGASAPADVMMEKFGFTAENIVSEALRYLKREPV